MNQSQMTMPSPGPFLHALLGEASPEIIRQQRLHDKVYAYADTHVPAARRMLDENRLLAAKVAFEDYLVVYADYVTRRNHRRIMRWIDVICTN